MGSYFTQITLVLMDVTIIYLKVVSSNIGKMHFVVKTVNFDMKRDGSSNL